MYKVLTVVGPTAVGKSDMGIRLAQDFNGEIVNGDSIQVYRQLSIGSARITEEEMQGIKHHLLSYKDVGEPYNVHQFQNDARKAINEIVASGHLPIVVGGTGLYIKALLYDYDFMENSGEMSSYDTEATEDLYQRLQLLDLVTAEGIHPHNRQRIVRALQMAESGNLKSMQEARQKHEMIYDSLIIGLTVPRELLKKRIDMRVDRMFEEGLLEEVTGLNEKYSWKDHGLHGIGYREFETYFAGSQSLEETRELIAVHTRQFAKRQYTWWNHQMPVIWYDVSEENSYERISGDVRKWLNGTAV